MISRLRLISGIILTAFVVGHFINHSLGIISLKAMNDALKYFIQPWRDPFGATLLIGALIVHVVLAFHALYRRRTLTMTKGDAFQLISGFLIPLLLGAHVLATRGIHEVFGVVEGYQFLLYGMWIPSIFYGVINVIALPVVWFHTCLGWHYWLRLKPWYPRVQPWAFAFAILLPTLALAGFASASLRVSRLSNSERWVERLFSRTQEQFPELLAFIGNGERAIWIGVPAAIAIVLLLRLVRKGLNNKRTASRVIYRGSGFREKRELTLLPGVNLLEQFRVAEIPHASVCGGRGRCSTCRIRIDSGLDELPAADANELKVLSRISASPNVRLACQTVPTGSLSVTALLAPDSGPQVAQQRDRIGSGDEQDIAILFADIREFTKLSETKLPYDTAFLLNRYFAAMGQAIESSGGHLDKFIGDGVMALFGVDEGVESGSKKAILAAAKMSKHLNILNESLKEDLDEELRIGIGIHSGTAIVGKMGYNKAVGLTAIGDVVNTASRLESLTKEKQVQLIISQSTIDRSGFSLAEFDEDNVAIRGREKPMKVRLIPKGTDISVG